MRLRPLLLLCLVAGCNGTDLTPKFVGTWAATAGKATTSCPGGSAIPDLDLAATGAMLTVTSDNAQKLRVTTSTNTACPINFSVAGNLATADAGQSCTGGSVTVTVTSSTLTLSGDTLAVTADTSETINGKACTGSYVGVIATRR